MTISFDRPVGSHLDLKELEYLTALHQTGNKLRVDGSVTSDDVVNFLISRHGIKADKLAVEKTLMPELSGAMGPASSATFDVVDLAAMLLIPHLKQRAANSDEVASEQLFGCVVRTILSDAFGSADRKSLQLNHETLSSIMEAYGEENASPQLLEEMLEVVRGKSNKDAVLDVGALICATTSDIDCYNNGWADQLTTHYDDVAHDLANTPEQPFGEPLAKLEQGLQREEKPMKNITTFAAIDYVAETYTSKAFVTLLWVLIVALYFVYFFQLQTSFALVECDRFRGDFGCTVVNAIVTWLSIFVQLSVIGTIFIAFASAGSSVYSRRGIRAVALICVGIAAVLVASVFTYVFDGDFFFFSLQKEPDFLFQAAYVMCLVIGIVLMALQLKKLAYIVVPRKFLEKLPLSGFWLVPGMPKAERATKRAADYKVAKMVDNALRMHGSAMAPSASGRAAVGSALLNFQATAGERESCGGVVWAYKKLWDGSILEEDGVWIHARLIASNLAQYFVALFYLFVGITVIVLFRDALVATPAGSEATPTTAPPFMMPVASPVGMVPTPNFPTTNNNGLNPDVQAALEWAPATLQRLASQTDDFNFEFWNQIDPDIATNLSAGILSAVPDTVVQAIVNSTSVDALLTFVDAAKALLNATESVSRRQLQDSTDDDLVASLTPETWSIFFSVGMGGFAAIVATLSVAIMWLPSAVSTVLQFRSGFLGSLHDSDFQQYREAPDLTTILFGSAFWGAVYTSGTLFLIVGGLAFVIVWQVTQPIVLLILAQVIGIGVTLLTKVLVLLFLRRLLFTGFFRKQPAYANVLLVVFESWSLGLTVGTMFVRLLKLILVSAFCIARIDTPILARGVGHIGPVALDSYPIQFRKDLLVHDAHRHPYMERLGVLYLLKLQHGNKFGTRAGSAWRLIFVQALMPWLRRYRLTSAKGNDDDTQQQPRQDVAKEVLTNRPLINRNDEVRNNHHPSVREMQQEIDRLRQLVEELRDEKNEDSIKVTDKTKRKKKNKKKQFETSLES